MLTTRRPARARAQALRLVSQILLAVQLLSLGHLFSVGHTTCPEHGDIVHVEHSAEATSASLAAARDVTRGSYIAPTKTSVTAELAHCLVCAESNRRCLLTIPAQTSCLQGLVVTSPHSVSTEAFASVDLILLSPKTSPPLA
jgi:hypothetical protein